MKPKYTITKIDAYGLSERNMGEATEADAAGYREWLSQRLAAQFPGAEIDLHEEDATHSCRVQIDGEEEYNWHGEPKHVAEVEQFLGECWERCPWDWAA